MDTILEFLEKDARLTPAQIAVMTERDEGDIKKAIADFEKDGTILGYQALIDWDKTDREYVNAVIELKSTPQRDCGFDKVAEKIYSYPEVESLYLMSGAYDLHLVLEGRTMREVAQFVAAKLAPLESIISTSTHFVLKKYKDKGVIYGTGEQDERGNCMI